MVSKKIKIFRFLCLLGTIGCTIVLVFESCLNSKTSAGHSNVVGGGIADIYNDIKGDQTVAVEPVSVDITNKISEANIGDTYVLSLKTEPENATYQSYLFSSSNESIASVSETGEISFISEGKVIISVVNSHYDKVNTSVEIESKVVKAESLNVEVNANFEGDSYRLLIGKSYLISTNILPINTTYKNVKYETSSTNIKLSEDGVITPLVESDTPISITVSLDEIVTEILVLPYVYKEEIVDLISISSTENIEIFLSQSITPKITYNPSNATVRGYSLVSSDEEIISISKNTIKGIKVGTAIVTVISKADDNIKFDITVTVKEQPKIESFSVYLSGSITKGTSKKIRVSNIKPKYSTYESITYISNNLEIATVDNEGNVKGINAGSTTITVTIDEIAVDVNITVIEKPSVELDKTEDFDLELLKGENPIVYTNEEIDLNEFYRVSKWYPINYTPTNTKIVYSSNSPCLEINNNILMIKTPGEYELHIIHEISNIEKIVKISAIDDFRITIDGNDINENILNINALKKIKMNLILPERDNINASFEVKSSNNKILSVIEENDLYMLNSLKEGEVEITITPIYDNVKYEDFSKEITIISKNKYTDSITLTGILHSNLNKDVELSIDNNSINIYKNETVSLNTLVSKDTSIFQFSFKSNNSRIVKVSNNGVITPVKTGNAIITISEEFSDKTIELNVYVHNYIKIDEANPFTLEGKNTKYDVNTKTLTIENGHSSKLVLNFTNNSTFKQCKYKSSNSKILDIGLDGKITPHKVGKTTIEIIVDDNSSDEPFIKYTLNVEVTRQNSIINMSEFLYFIRKGIGHFGAFLVFGICSTLTFLLYFRYKHYLWSVPVNFFYGFFLAALTEYIQTFVPGRCGRWADVILDFSGFISSALILTIFIVPISILKKYKRTKLNN